MWTKAKNTMEVGEDTTSFLVGAAQFEKKNEEI